MEKKLEIGILGEQQLIVDESVSAKKAASGEMDVFGTPFVIALMEQTADKSVRPYLEDGQATVGTMVNINHLVATPMGMKAWGKSELTGIDGRRLTFKVEVYDEVGLVASGTHDRFIIFKEKFMEKVQKRGK